MGRSSKYFKKKYGNSARRAQSDRTDNVVDIYYALAGFYFFRDKDLLPKGNKENLLLSLDLQKGHQVQPRLRRLLIIIFRLCYEEREHFDTKNKETGITDNFLARVLPSLQPSPQGQEVSGAASTSSTSTAKPVRKVGAFRTAFLQHLTPDTLRRLINLYVSGRREFRLRSVERERLRMRKGPSGDGMAVDREDDKDPEDVEDSALVVEEDHGVDYEGDLFIYGELMYRPEAHTSNENKLVKYVDQWIVWIDEQQGNAVPPSLIENLMIL
ncbi:hypothetical protein F5B20DRAFT_585011 [Whalleya microplaca]|nr:hypothetical protein F5B20DRAFT_585011 [Whalleya microplaca]